MTDEEWNGLSTFAQLSNIAGDVKRCVDSRQNFLAGIIANFILIRLPVCLIPYYKKKKIFPENRNFWMN